MRTGPRDRVKHRKARELRFEGPPYKRIAALLQISPATALAWTKDIELTSQQKQANLRGPNGPLNPERVRRAAATWAARCRAFRAVCQADGRETARNGDPLHLARVM